MNREIVIEAPRESGWRKLLRRDWRKFRFYRYADAETHTCFLLTLGCLAALPVWLAWIALR